MSKVNFSGNDHAEATRRRVEREARISKTEDCHGVLRIGEQVWKCDVPVLVSENDIGHDGPCSNETVDAQWASGIHADEPIRAMQ